MRRVSSQHRRGFTLIEASMVIVIIGVGVVSMLELMASGTMANSESSMKVSGLTLARNFREHAITLSYDEVRALNGHTYTTPIGADGAVLNGFDDWQQTIQIQPVDPANLLATLSSSSPAAVRVTAHAVFRGERKASISWYQFKVGL